MLGREVRIDELLTAIAAKDPAVAPAVVVSCRFPQGQVEAEARANIVEIRLVLSKDFTPQTVEQVGFRHNSGCPHGAGFLPGGFKGE